MKRIFAVILAMSLLLSLAACGKKSETVSVSPTPAAAPTETLTPTAAPEPTPTPTPVPVMPELPEVHDEALNALLTDVLTVYPGSAGCSLRAAGCAARLLDWGMETALTDDEIYSAVGSFLDTLGDEDLHSWRAFCPSTTPATTCAGNTAKGCSPTRGFPTACTPGMTGPSAPWR